MAFTLSKEVKIGVFGLLMGAALYMGVNFLKGSDMFTTSSQVIAVFTDVGGLQVSNPVLVNGLAVGRVKDLRLAPGTERKVVAELEIDANDVVLYKGTRATLISSDLLGGKAVRLTLPARDTQPLVTGDTIPADVEVGITEEIYKKVNPMLANLDSVSLELKGLLRSFRGTGATLERTMNSFRGTSDATKSLLADNQTNIKAITSNAARLTGQLAETERELNKMVGKFNTFGDSLNRVKLASTVANLNKTVTGLNGVLKQMNEGQGTLGKLTKNDSLYRNLNHSSESLDALLKDMKARPGRYIHFSVFGKKDKP